MTTLLRVAFVLASISACANATSHGGGGGAANDSDASTHETFVDAMPDAPPSGNGLWVRTGVTQDGAYLDQMTVDTDGSIVAVGTYWDTLDFGVGAITPRGNGADVFVVKVAADGTVLWSRSLGGCESEGNPYVAIGADHAVYVYLSTGFWGSDPGCHPQFAGARVPTSFATGAASMVTMLAKYASDGKELWAKAYGPAGAASVVSALAIAGDRLVISGTAGTAIDFGNGVTSPQTSHAFVAAVHTSDGNGIWARPMQNVTPRAALVDGDQLLLAIRSLNNADIGAPSPEPCAGQFDVIVESLAVDTGAYRWHRRYGGTGDDEVTSISRASDGSFWLAGTFSGASADYGGVMLSASTYDGWALHVTDAGQPLVAFATGAAVHTEVLGAASYGDGIVVAEVSGGNAAVARYDGAGARLWHHALAAAPSTSQARAVSTHNDQITLGGWFWPSLTIPSLPPLGQANAQIFIARLAP